MAEGEKLYLRPPGLRFLLQMQGVVVFSQAIVSVEFSNDGGLPSLQG
jgi:hypothetical protein